VDVCFSADNGNPNANTKEDRQKKICQRKVNKERDRFKLKAWREAVVVAKDGLTVPFSTKREEGLT